MNQYFRSGGLNSIPMVVKNLLIINILMFAATVVVQQRLHIDLTDTLGLHYYKSDLFKPHQFITYLFMHGGIMHLVLNMFGLWMFGSVLENVWGPKRFLQYYLITGLGAGLIQYIVFYFQAENLDHWAAAKLQEFGQEALPLIMEKKQQALDHMVVIGASGSLFGILLAYGMLFPNDLLMMMFIPIPIKAKYMVALYGAFELFSGLSNDPLDNVAHFAHLGGMLFGFIVILIWKKNRNFFY